MKRDAKKTMILVWEYMRDALGGDGWDNWTENDIVDAMSSWMTDDVAPEIQAHELIEDAFDPRDVRK